ncbi:hypothetical protein [Aureimonas jatrophae]|uniref:Uncharacterized protein n=1 Tax=Aureimonas jatrophae TaxID=1166073 RepID=A0A1H0HJG0_9HYPH|nr:hypothetical protein [Aureimonas jatrophae]MBB3950623.1 hypothetical protein [Aureimonas jatrophae]SDO19335.1 hypothetical protein SAMN05192530_104131 [Aureimonas jatrophae]
MTDLATIVTNPALQSRIRDALRRSPIHRLEERLPGRITQLLAELDRAETRRPLH